MPPDLVWPVCRTDEEHSRPCHCLGDPDITDPEVCKDLEGGECKAKVMLDKLCRNNTVIKSKVTSDYKTNIPLKDRCGVYDLEVATNPCTSAEVGVRVSSYFVFISMFVCIANLYIIYPNVVRLLVSLSVHLNYSTMKLATN